MSWIHEADVQLPNVIKSMSINPKAMEAVQGLNRAITYGASSLTRVQEEAIATTVSVANRCRYRTMAHGGFLRQHSDDPELVSHIMHDYTKTNLDPQTRSMLDFATKLTLTPAAMEKSDVEGLQRQGLTDDQILSIVLITCTFNFMTRLADGLGVEVDHGRQEAAERWLTGPVLEQGWLMNPREH